MTHEFLPVQYLLDVANGTRQGVRIAAEHMLQSAS